MDTSIIPFITSSLYYHVTVFTLCIGNEVLMHCILFIDSATLQSL